MVGLIVRRARPTSTTERSPMSRSRRATEQFSSSWKNYGFTFASREEEAAAYLPDALLQTAHKPGISCNNEQVPGHS